jgi:hypothetical protein
LSNVPVRAARAGQQVTTAPETAAPKPQATAAAAGRPSASALLNPPGKADSARQAQAASSVAPGAQAADSPGTDKASEGPSTSTVTAVNPGTVQPITAGAQHQEQHAGQSQPRSNSRPASAAPAAFAWSGGLHSAPSQLAARTIVGVTSSAVTKQRPATASTYRSKTANMTEWDCLNMSSRTTIVPTAKTMARYA